MEMVKVDLSVIPKSLGNQEIQPLLSLYGPVQLLQIVTSPVPIAEQTILSSGARDQMVSLSCVILAACFINCTVHIDRQRRGKRFIDVIA
jgi:hypothetical protein